MFRASAAAAQCFTVRLPCRGHLISPAAGASFHPLRVVTVAAFADSAIRGGAGGPLRESTAAHTSVLGGCHDAHEAPPGLRIVVRRGLIGVTLPVES